MSIFTRQIIVSTKEFCDIVNITDKVRDVLKKSKIENGVVNVFAVGSTAGITTIEYEPNLIKDFQELIEKLIPRDKTYHHDLTWGEGNGFSHLRASLLGSSLTVPLENSKLQLGTWQQIVLINFDNRPRNRKLIINVTGE